MINSLFRRATEIADSFRSIVNEDQAVDKAYSSKKSEIESKHASKIASLETTRQSRISAAVSSDKVAQSNIQSALSALAQSESKIPVKYKKKYHSKQVAPCKPDFQAIDDLACKINDRSFKGKAKRVVKAGGYSSLSNMINDFFDMIEGGKEFLKIEQQKSSDYVSHETASANADYAREKSAADNKKASFHAQNDSFLKQRGDSLQSKFLGLVNDPALKQFDEDLIQMLEDLGAFDETWQSYEPSTVYPSQLMIGAVTIPLVIPSPANQMIREKIPIAYSSDRGLCVPINLSMNKPIQMLVKYDERCKSAVMEGIQSIILKWIRFMPPYSFCITYIDPSDRGSNLGQLQRLEDIASWDLCKKVYASKEDISRRLKELERFVDATCSKLAGIDSAYEYNASNEQPLVQQLIVINDFPENIDRAAEESLEVLIKNAEKCGISMIFTKKGDIFDLPQVVQNSFLRINATTNGNTIQSSNRSYDFQFDTVPSSTDQFIEAVKTVYRDGFRVDNSFTNYFTLEKFTGYRDATESLLIPFAVNSRKQLVELELGAPLSAHALLSGATGSGKSTTLHMLITSIILNYHPDDVELWLVDYNKVEFADYISNLPPHVKLIGLERGKEFTRSLLDMVNQECLRRMELFKQCGGISDIKEYKKKYGVRSLPRIILMIDEFHQLTQAIQDEPEYVTILENILSEYRKFGLSCFFSDQAISTGLRGLTEKGKKQMRARLAMANDEEEIKETLSIRTFSDSLAEAVKHLTVGDVIFKRSISDSSGQDQIIIDKYRSIYVNKDERMKSIAFARKQLDHDYAKEDVIIVDGKGRNHVDEDAILKFETIHGSPTTANIPIYVGTPATLDSCFCFNLQDRLDSNIIVVGADTEMRASIVLYTISCFSRIDDYRIAIFADERDELYQQYRDSLLAFKSDRICISTKISDVCSYLDGLMDNARDGNQPKTLLVWLGIESIGADLSMFPEKDKSQGIRTAKVDNSVAELMDEIDSLLSGLEESDTSVKIESNDREKKAISTTNMYDARDDISELIVRGSRFGIHNLVALPSVKVLRQARFIKLDSFEHKIAFSMSRDDWSNYLERVRYVDTLDAVSAVYYDGGSNIRVFRPYLL